MAWVRVFQGGWWDAHSIDLTIYKQIVMQVERNRYGMNINCEVGFSKYTAMYAVLIEAHKSHRTLIHTTHITYTYYNAYIHTYIPL